MTRAARRNLDLAAGTLSVVVLADSAVEHSRGGFYNRVMFAAPLLSSMTLATSIRAQERCRAARDGRLENWTQNIHAAPPIPAPPAFTAMALAGLAALDLIDDERRDV